MDEALRALARPEGGYTNELPFALQLPSTV